MPTLWYNFAIATLLVSMVTLCDGAASSIETGAKTSTHNRTAIAMVLVSDFSTGGLMRLPRFLKQVLVNIREEQLLRDAANEPSLFNPYMRLDDVIYATIIGLCLFFFRIQMRNRLMPRLFPNQAPKLIAKLTEDLYYTGYYTLVFSYFVLVVLPNVEWGTNLLKNDTIVVYDLLHPTFPTMNLVERWYYIQAGGFYLSAWMFLTMYDSRRSDFMQYVIHHVVTIAMIVLSYTYGFVRVGMVVLAVHDVGDIFLYSSKFFHHLGIHGIDIFLFALFAVTFYIGRLVLYSRIVHAIVIEALQVLCVAPKFNSWAMYYDTYLPQYAIFTVALTTLLALHCFWFMLVLRLIGDELFFGKKISEVGDIRSDDEDDEPLEKHEDFDDDDIAKPKQS